MSEVIISRRGSSGNSNGKGHLVTEIITKNMNWTVPDNVINNSFDVRIIGGGGGGYFSIQNLSNCNRAIYIYGGGSGHINNTIFTNLSSNQVIPIVIGQGGYSYVYSSYNRGNVSHILDFKVGFFSQNSNRTQSSGSSSYWYNYNTQYNTFLNNSTSGGTTTFGNYLSANGGSPANYSNSCGGDGGAGGGGYNGGKGEMFGGGGSSGFWSGYNGGNGGTYGGGGGGSSYYGGKGGIYGGGGGGKYYGNGGTYGGNGGNWNNNANNGTNTWSNSSLNSLVKGYGLRGNFGSSYKYCGGGGYGGNGGKGESNNSGGGGGGYGGDGGNGEYYGSGGGGGYGRIAKGGDALRLHPYITSGGGGYFCPANGAGGGGLGILDKNGQLVSSFGSGGGGGEIYNEAKVMNSNSYSINGSFMNLDFNRISEVFYNSIATEDGVCIIQYYTK